MPPRSQPPGVRLSGRLRPVLQPFPGSTASGDLRRTAELRRPATQHRRGSHRRVRRPAAYGLGSPGQHSRLLEAGRLRSRAGSSPGTLRLRGVVPPGTDSLAPGPGPRVPQGAARPVPRRVGAAAAGRGAEEAGPRAHRCQAGRRPSTRRGEGAGWFARGEAGGDDLRPPGDQGQPGQALGDRHAGPRRQAGRHRGHRRPGRRSLLAQRQLPAPPCSTTSASARRTASARSRGPAALPP